MPRRFTSSLAVIGSLAVSLFLVGGAKANADTLFESAQLPPDWLGIGDVATGLGTTGGGEFVGVRFSTTQDEIITALGARAADDGELGPLYLALVPLSSPDAFPKSSTLSDAIFHSLINVQRRFGPLLVKSSDTTVDTNFLLPAGNYALIVGSNLFGATGTGFLPDNNINGTTTQFFYFDPMNARFNNGYQNMPAANARFYVEGHSLAPEPNSLALLATGALPLLGLLRRRILSEG